MAVKSFREWAVSAGEDPEIKARFYPNISKSKLLEECISDKSTHSRGSTVDLLNNWFGFRQRAWYGDRIWFLDSKSNTDFADLSEELKQNREVLRIAIEIHGFKGYKWE